MDYFQFMNMCFILTVWLKKLSVELIAVNRVLKVHSTEQNLHWKLGQLMPSFGYILAYLETTA